MSTAGKAPRGATVPAFSVARSVFALLAALSIAACSSSSSGGGLGPICSAYTAPNGCCEQAAKGDVAAAVACAQFAQTAKGASSSELSTLEATCTQSMNAAIAAGLCQGTPVDAGSANDGGGATLGACAELAACCKELTGDSQTVCSQAVAVGDSSTCASEFLVVATGGHCQNVGPTGVCTGAEVVCSGGCVDLTSDAANCGSCGHACPGTPGVGSGVCRSGQCALACEGTKTFCGGACVDTTTDPSNCGACGSDCAAKLASLLNQAVPGTGQADTSTVACTSGVCQAHVNDETVNCLDSACTGVTCDQLCKGKFGVPCDPNGSLQLIGCGATGGCSSYYGSNTSCFPGVSCGVVPSASITCQGEAATLGNMTCACSGSVAL
jgi:hypothetical protein